MSWACAMQEDKANLYQFLYHVTIVVTFQVKSCPGSFCFYFADQKLVSTLTKSDQFFCLLMIRTFVNFPRSPRILSAERIRGIRGNF